MAVADHERTSTHSAIFTAPTSSPRSAIDWVSGAPASFASGWMPVSLLVCRV